MITVLYNSGLIDSLKNILNISLSMLGIKDKNLSINTSYLLKESREEYTALSVLASSKEANDTFKLRLFD